jgi:2-amino-4-hydroxy-6-hydroxymethyldihydropteridine diphosphokinase
MSRAFVAIGSNLGDRGAILVRALSELAEDFQITAVSPTFSTVAVGRSGPAFLNAAFALETTLAPSALLARLLEQEQRQGRVRREKWALRRSDHRRAGLPRTASSA